jgi:hypothetical protein
MQMPKMLNIVSPIQLLYARGFFQYFIIPFRCRVYQIIRIKYLKLNFHYWPSLNKFETLIYKIPARRNFIRGMSGKFIYFIIFYCITIHTLYKFCQHKYTYLANTFNQKLLNCDLRLYFYSIYIQHIYIVMEHFDNVNSVSLTSCLSTIQFLPI